MTRGPRMLARIGGGAIVVGALGFVAVFAYLATVFGYPDVLARPAHEVLPALETGGATMRGAWLIYSALPLTLLAGGLASMAVLERGGGRMLARVGGAAAAIAAVAMMAGLLRWPSLQWALAERWVEATAEQRAVYAAIFDGANTYLGAMIGEYLGETMLAVWFVTMGVALRGMHRRWLGAGSIAMGVIVALAAQRQLTHLVDPIADVNNALLPVWLLVVGGVVWRDLRAPTLRPEMPSGSVPSTV